jgi:hypothetical protein
VAVWRFGAQERDQPPANPTPIITRRSRASIAVFLMSAKGPHSAGIGSECGDFQLGFLIASYEGFYKAAEAPRRNRKEADYLAPS